MEREIDIERGRVGQKVREGEKEGERERKLHNKFNVRLIHYLYLDVVL